jgi:hypothetical protein
LRIFLSVCAVLATLAVSSATFETAAMPRMELSFNGSYSHLNFGSSGDTDLGSSGNLDLRARVGWLIGKGHLVGVFGGLTENERESRDLGIDIEQENSLIGVVYQYNFRTAGRGLPFVGVNGAVIGGDLGDSYDYSLGVEAGYKIFFTTHVGASFGMRVTELFEGRDDVDIPDASSTAAVIGLVFRP